MQALRKSTVIRSCRWTDDEYRTASRIYMPMKIACPDMKIAELCIHCQADIPPERQKSFDDKTGKAVYAFSTRLSDAWYTFAKREPEHAQRLISEAFEKIKVTLDEPHADVISAPIQECIEPEEIPEPIPVVHVQQSSSPTLGPIELALSAMVQRAVEGSVMALINEMRSAMADERVFLQGLTNAQHDSLLSYFDPDFKRSREVMAEFVTESITGPKARLEEHRIRRKQILIVCTNNIAGIQRSLEPKFRGIDFTFIDGNSKASTLSGFYDLIICNATVRHSIKNMLVDQQGTKVIFTDGGTTSMIEHIRKRLAI